MKNFVKLIILSALIINIGIVMSYDLADVFKEAAAAYDIAQTADEKKRILPVMIGSYGGLSAERADESDVGNLADDDEFKAKLDLVSEENRKKNVAAQKVLLKAQFPAYID